MVYDAMAECECRQTNPRVLSSNKITGADTVISEGDWTTNVRNSNMEVNGGSFKFCAPIRK